MSIEVCPCFPVLDVPDQRVTDTVVGRNGSMGSFISANSKNLILRKLGLMVAFPDKLSFRASTSVHHVLSVLSLSSWNEMGGVAARSVVAGVPDDDARSSAWSIYLAICLLIGFYMGGKETVTGPKPSVPASYGTEPRPAFVWSANIDVTPELSPSIFQRLFTALNSAWIRAKDGFARPAWLNVKGFPTRCADDCGFVLPSREILTQTLAIVLLSEARWKLLEVISTAITLHGDLFDRHVPCPDVCVSPTSSGSSPTSPAFLDPGASRTGRTGNGVLTP